MPCFHPKTAYLSEYNTNYKTGKPYRRVSFKESDDCDRPIQLPCGQCVGCRLERSRQWATRCLHEAQLHEKNCFITLTYDNENLPDNLSLNHRDFQLFFKRFRKSNPHIKIRYYMAGEYGSTFGRPHFHACIFGYDFHDKELFKRTASGFVLYRSEELEKLWPHGYSTIGDVTFESAAYVARYIMQKYTGEMQNGKHKINPDHYSYCDLQTGELIKLLPEYNKMSLKPGIGADWYKKYKDEVYPNDNVVIRGKLCKPPRYYDTLYSRDNPYEYDELLFKREKQGKLKPEEKTPERLQVKEKVLKARINLNKRTNLETNE
jgi:hypothetical protein